jgi:uncharacterized protein YqgV (UPF0045/DUF77 family)
MIVEIQCLPDPPGTAANRYAHIEAAIAVIQASGLPYEVGALGTTVEGPPDRLWPLVRAVHEACLASGATGVVSVIKVAESAREGPTIAALTGKFRP